jgi:hypothetical protein
MLCRALSPRIPMGPRPECALSNSPASALKHFCDCTLHFLSRPDVIPIVDTEENGCVRDEPEALLRQDATTIAEGADRKDTCRKFLRRAPCKARTHLNSANKQVAAGKAQSLRTLQVNNNSNVGILHVREGRTHWCASAQLCREERWRRARFTLCQRCTPCCNPDGEAPSNGDTFASDQFGSHTSSASILSTDPCTMSALPLPRISPRKADS